MELVCKKKTYPNSSQQIKCQETGENQRRVGAKREHVEAITGCRQDRLAFGLPGASKLLIHQPSLFSQSNNAITSSLDCETLRSFIMLLSLCISGWERNKCVNLDSNSDSFAKTKGEIPDGDVMQSVESSTLRLGGVRRLLKLLDCGDCQKRINSWKTHSHLAVFL